MRALLIVTMFACACEPPPAPVYAPPARFAQPPRDPTDLGHLDQRRSDFLFEGGYVELELWRDGTHVVQVARSRFAVPVAIHWSITNLDNLEPMSAVEGVAVLPAAGKPLGLGPTVRLASLQQIDPQRPYRRELYVRARFGDPDARPSPYIYGLPYPHGLAFSVLQGPHGAFSHRGSNEFAVDFDCPVATPVVATRPGLVVAANAAAQGAGTTAAFLDYKRVNFVMVLHDDGTLGEYMHLAPSSITVAPGQRVERGQQLALSGFTGFSSTPHLHFQVMTAAPDGIAARSFPFQLAVAPRRVEAPVQGHRYAAWE